MDVNIFRKLEFPAKSWYFIGIWSNITGPIRSLVLGKMGKII